MAARRLNSRRANGRRGRRVGRPGNRCRRLILRARCRSANVRSAAAGFLTPFETAVTLDAHAAKSVKVPALHLEHPRLWWPNGYGDPNLYAVQLVFETADHQVSNTNWTA